MKKLTLYVLALVMVLSLAACSTSEPAAQTTAAQTAAQSTTAPAAQSATNAPADSGQQQADDPLAKYMPIEGKVYELHWSSNASAFTDEDAPMIQYWNEVFNVDIKYVNIENSKREELMNLRIAGGDIPDIFFCSSLPTFAKWAEEGILAEIPQDLLKRLWTVSYDQIEALHSAYFNENKVDGKIYGLRSIWAMSLYRQLIAWRKDWLASVGINKIPETFAEAEDAFYRFANNDPDGNGKKDTYAFSLDGMTAIFGAYGLIPGTLSKGASGPAGPWIIGSDGNVVNSRVLPETREAIEKMAQWYKDGLIDPEFITGENTGGDGNISHAFITGKIGMSTRQSFYAWMPAQISGGYQGINYTELEKIYPGEVDNVLGYGGPLDIPGKNSVLPQPPKLQNTSYVFSYELTEKEPDKLGKILSMMEYWQSDAEHFRTAHMGLQGVHWDLFDGAPGAIEPYSNVSELCKIGGQQTMSFIRIPQIQFDMIDVGHGIFAAAQSCDNGGLQNAINGVLPSAAKYTDEQQTLYEEMLLSIITGDKPITAFDTFVDEWYKLGGEILTKEANELYQSTR